MFEYASIIKSISQVAGLPFNAKKVQQISPHSISSVVLCGIAGPLLVQCHDERISKEKATLKKLFQAVLFVWTDFNWSLFRLGLDFSALTTALKVEFLGGPVIKLKLPIARPASLAGGGPSAFE